MRKSGQNLVEFVLVLPLLVVLLLALIELALYWRTVQVVQETALEAALVASQAYVPENQGGYNLAAHNASLLVLKRAKKIDPDGFNFSWKSFGDNAPFNFQEYLDPGGCDSTVPLSCKAWLRVDYRDPYAKGVIVQLGYKYNPMFLGLEFSIPRSDGAKKIVIIPKEIQISSTKIQQYVTY